MSFYRITGLTCEVKITDIGLFTRTVNTMLMEAILTSLAINTTYFPNSYYEFWSSSPYAGRSSGAWYVFFVGVKEDQVFR
jgi:hypothetical protein